jgi:hypothetical protein
VTALNHTQDARELTCADYNMRKHSDLNTAKPTPTYTYLETLRHDYNNGVPSAVAFMQGLRDYTEECLEEQAEWKADEQAAIRKNHNITYPKRDYLARPRSWDAVDEDPNGLPCIIEGSRPLGAALKRRRY